MGSKQALLGRLRILKSEASASHSTNCVSDFGVKSRASPDRFRGMISS